LARPAISSVGRLLGGLAVAGAVAVPETSRRPRAELRVDVRPVGEDPQLHVLAHVIAGVADEVGDEVLAIGVGHDLAVQCARLNEVVVLGVLLVRVAAELARFDRPTEIGRALRIGLRAAEAVGGVHGRRAGVVIGHRRILVVGMHLDLGRVDRQLLVVRPDPVQMRVVIGEDPAHQHLVGAEADARHQVRGREARLLDLGEEVIRVAIQHQPPDGDRRVVRVGPHLGQVERVEAVVGRFGERHDLHLEPPLGGLVAIDRGTEVAPVEVRILRRHRLGLTSAACRGPTSGS
jgi:hypothetical protein